MPGEPESLRGSTARTPEATRAAGPAGRSSGLSADPRASARASAGRLIRATSSPRAADALPTPSPYEDPRASISAPASATAAALPMSTPEIDRASDSVSRARGRARSMTWNAPIMTADTPRPDPNMAAP